jgi:repressor LexA
MDTLQPLTERQKMILDFIKQSIRERGYPPSLREIGSHMGIKSTNGVNDHLTALERKGYLRRDSMKSRALQPTEMIERASTARAEAVSAALETESQPANEDATVRVEVKGTVAAGGLNELYESSRGSYSVDRAMLGTPASAEVFALEVQGDSMVDAGIHEGDTVFVRRTTDARKGDIVVARVNGTGTLKRYYPEKDQVRLQPENKKYSPIIVPRARMEQSEFAIVGVVTGLFRKI